MDNSSLNKTSKSSKFFKRNKLNMLKYLNKNKKLIWKNSLRNEIHGQLSNFNGNTQGNDQEFIIKNYQIQSHKIQSLLQNSYCILTEENIDINISYEEYFKRLIDLKILVDHEGYTKNQKENGIIINPKNSKITIFQKKSKSLIFKEF